MNIDPVLLYQYGMWANDRVIQGAAMLDPERLTEPLRPGFQSALGLLVHILAAEQIWLSRWKGISPSRLPTVEDIPSLEALKNAWVPLRAEMMDFLANLERPDQVLLYHSTKGDEYRNVLWHLILHVINHGTEHRSQVALYLAGLGIDLGNLDFVYFLRSLA